MAAARLRRCLVAVGFGVTVVGCVEPTKLDAAADIHALMISIRDDDQTAFDAHVDRPALKAQLLGRLEQEAERRADLDPSVAELGATLVRPLVDAAADQLVQPTVFRLVAEQYGYSAKTPIPAPLLIARALKRIDDADVCVTGKGDACVLSFRDESGVWRLVGFEGDRAMLRPRGGG